MLTFIARFAIALSRFSGIVLRTHVQMQHNDCMKKYTRPIELQLVLWAPVDELCGEPEEIRDLGIVTGS